MLALTGSNLTPEGTPSDASLFPNGNRESTTSNIPWVGDFLTYTQVKDMPGIFSADTGKLPFRGESSPRSHGYRISSGRTLDFSTFDQLTNDQGLTLFLKPGDVVNVQGIVLRGNIINFGHFLNGYFANFGGSSYIIPAGLWPARGNNPGYVVIDKSISSIQESPPRTISQHFLRLPEGKDNHRIPVSPSQLALGYECCVEVNSDRTKPSTDDMFLFSFRNEGPGLCLLSFSKPTVQTFESIVSDYKLLFP